MLLGRTVEMVGREREREVLEGLVGGVAAGRGGTGLIVGEPGIGKSTLLAAGLAAANAVGCQVLTVRCDEFGEQVPLAAMARMLRVRPDAADPRRPDADHGLAEQAPAAGWSTRLVIGDPVAAATERLLALVDRLCAAGPVVLAAEDLQWADEASLLMWRRLNRATVQLPLLLLGTCRPVPCPPELEWFRRELRGRGGRLVSLERLSDADVVQLAARLVGAAPGPALVTRLEAAAGNPLYVRELLDALARVGALSPACGTVELVEGDLRAAELDALGGVIEDRLHGLSPGTQEVLRAASLLGAEFTVADLAVVTGHGTGPLLAAVEEALHADVLESVESRLVFRHGVLKEVLHEATPPGQRAVLRGRAAKRLISAHAPVERVAELMVPALEAVDGWELDWLAENAQRLADRAPTVALELLEHTLRHTPVDDARHPVLAAELAAVYYFRTDRFDQVERLAHDTLLGARNPEITGWASWLLVRIRMLQGRYEEVVAAGPAVSSAPAVPPLWQARIAALRTTALAALGRFGPARKETARLLAEGERLKDPTVLGYTLHAASFISYRDADLPGALAHLDRSLALIGTEPDLLDLRLIQLGNRSVGLDRLDRPVESAEALAEARVLAERFSMPWLSVIYVRGAEMCFDAGRWDDALVALGEASGGSQRAWRLSYHSLLALISGRRGRWQEAIRHLDAVQGDAVTPYWPFTAAYLMLARSNAAEEAGRLGDAAQELAVLVSPPYKHLARMYPQRLAALVRAARNAADEPTARAAARLCHDLADREPRPGLRAAADWCSGLLHRDPGRLRSAADYYRSTERLPDHGNALEDLAVVRASAGETEAASAALAEAQSVYAALGAVWEARRAADRVRPWGVRASEASRPRPASGWEALTPTERRVAELVAQGLSNPDIAARLLLSRRTVETHVSHILAKLKVRSRREVGSVAGRS